MPRAYSPSPQGHPLLPYNVNPVNPGTGSAWSRLKKRNANAVTASNAGVSLLGMNPLFFTSFSACAVPKTEAPRRVSLVTLVVPCGTLSAYGTSYAVALVRGRTSVRRVRERNGAIG